MVIREDNVYLGFGKTGSVFHNWDTIEEAKASGRFDYILDSKLWEFDFKSEEEYLTFWNNITEWEQFEDISDYFYVCYGSEGQ